MGLGKGSQKKKKKEQEEEGRRKKEKKEKKKKNKPHSHDQAAMIERERGERAEIVIHMRMLFMLLDRQRPWCLAGPFGASNLPAQSWMLLGRTLGFRGRDFGHWAWQQKL